MRRLLIIILLTLLAHIFTTTVVKSSSDDELPWPPVKYINLKFSSRGKPSPPNATIMEVTRPPNSDFPFNFGQLSVFDNTLFTDLDSSNSLLGRSQGMFIMSDQNIEAVLMSMSLVFSGKLYMGSTLVLVGRLDFSSSVGDLPIVGGTGHFSYAQGVCKITRLMATPYDIDGYNCDVYYRSLLISDI